MGQAQQEVEERKCERIICYGERIDADELRISGSLKKANWEAFTGCSSREAPGTHKNRERKGPSLGIVQKCAPHKRSPCAPKFAERSQEDTLQQERCARRVAWNLAQNSYKLNNLDKATLSCPVEERRMPALISLLPEE